MTNETIFVWIILGFFVINSQTYFSVLLAFWNIPWKLIKYFISKRSLKVFCVGFVTVSSCHLRHSIVNLLPNWMLNLKIASISLDQFTRQSCLYITTEPSRQNNDNIEINCSWVYPITPRNWCCWFTPFEDIFGNFDFLLGKNKW